MLYRLRRKRCLPLHPHALPDEITTLLEPHPLDFDLGGVRLQVVEDPFTLPQAGRDWRISEGKHNILRIVVILQFRGPQEDWGNPLRQLPGGEILEGCRRLGQCNSLLHSRGVGYLCKSTVGRLYCLLLPIEDKIWNMTTIIATS